MSIRERFDNLSKALKLLVLLPPAAVAVFTIGAFASDQLPATRGRVKAVEAVVDTVRQDVAAGRAYDLELYAQQRQMLCLQEDQDAGRAERCLMVYQQAKQEGINP